MEKILWIDLEMTGLDVQKEVIIEAAAIITDIQFNELAEYHAVVHQDPKYLENMDDWNTKTHTKSGLKDLVKTGKAPNLVESELIELIEKYMGKDPAIIAGNSISQDRLFIDKHFPKLSNRLHYRMLDVSAFKMVFKSIYKVEFEKKGSHRALDDIRESIAELKHYLQYIKV